MKNVMLCGRPQGCCPSIKEERKAGIMYIVDGDQQIAFNKTEVENLTKYLNKRGS